jgi:carboxypeptidase PM20D1
MKTGAKIAWGGAAMVALLVGVVAVRTATYQPPADVDFSGVRLASAPSMDVDAAARHLSEAVQIPTVSHQNPADNDYAQWDRLHDWLATTYPAASGAMRREIVGDHSLIYTWPGSDPALKPIVLMAHQDVVPVTEGTEKDWRHPPFSGAIADNAVWGRGSVDDKGSLVALFEAANALAASGFHPRRTVIIVSGHDEEAGGSGARAAAAALAARGVKAEFVLDEGMVTISDMPMAGGPVSIVGVAEKGYATLRVTAPATGGHSSAPPPETGVEVLARAVLAITGHPEPMRFDGPGADMVRTIAPRASLLTRIAVANQWLFGPLIVRQIAATPTGAASLHTTIAPTMLRGSPKENVLPQDATAWINYRIAPGQTADSVMARARSAVEGLNVRLAWEGQANNPSPISSSRSQGWRWIGALAAGGGRFPVAPGLVTAGTDSRYMTPIADDIYRYQPLVVSMDTVKMIHGTNEHMTLDNLARTTQFYGRLIATAAGS